MIQSPNGLLPVFDWCVWYLDFIQLPNCCSGIDQIYQLCSKRGWILWNLVGTISVHFWKWSHCHSDSWSFCSGHHSYNRNCCKFFQNIPKCLKITQNVVFEIFLFGIFHQFLSYYLLSGNTLFKNSPNWTIFGTFSKLLSTLKTLHSQCWMRIFLWF